MRASSISFFCSLRPRSCRASSWSLPCSKPCGGWRARLLGLSLFPELFYAMFLNVVYVKGVWDLSLARQATWKHVVQPGAGARTEEG